MPLGSPPYEAPPYPAGRRAALLLVSFDADQESAWRSVVRSLGDQTRGMEDLPPDVSWNLSLIHI